jgi:hypothetical protein
MNTAAKIRAAIVAQGYSYTVVIAARNLEIDKRNTLQSTRQSVARNPSSFGPEDDAQWLLKLEGELQDAVALNRECEAGGRKDPATVRQFEIEKLIGD